ncbi:putative ribonuclease H protein [Senna tora]|uniref:Putative ribonuclease H protein n=1 Tax=Senna tora TaxID=362788 RepID=A0A834X9R3_9FABA|nr:putative ribonuclease H protein [Senna tora]
MLTSTSLRTIVDQVDCNFGVTFNLQKSVFFFPRNLEAVVDAPKLSTQNHGVPDSGSFGTISEQMNVGLSKSFTKWTHWAFVTPRGYPVIGCFLREVANDIVGILYCKSPIRIMFPIHEVNNSFVMGYLDLLVYQRSQAGKSPDPLIIPEINLTTISNSPENGVLRGIFSFIFQLKNLNPKRAFITYQVPGHLEQEAFIHVLKRFDSKASQVSRKANCFPTNLVQLPFFSRATPQKLPFQLFQLGDSSFGEHAMLHMVNWDCRQN